jgi:hypothetical protein
MKRYGPSVATCSDPSKRQLRVPATLLLGSRVSAVAATPDAIGAPVWFVDDQ